LKPETCNSAQRLGIAVEEVLKKGMEEKSKKFVEKGAEVH
jgi:hypothetical protein